MYNYPRPLSVGLILILLKPLSWIAVCDVSLYTFLVVATLLHRVSNKCFLHWCYVDLKVTLCYTMIVSSHSLWPWLMFFLLWMLSLMRTPCLMSMRVFNVYLHGGRSLSRHRCGEIGGNETWKQRESIIDCWVLREYADRTTFRAWPLTDTPSIETVLISRDRHVLVANSSLTFASNTYFTVEYVPDSHTILV